MWFQTVKAKNFVANNSFSLLWGFCLEVLVVKNEMITSTEREQVFCRELVAWWVFFELRELSEPLVYRTDNELCWGPRASCLLILVSKNFSSCVNVDYSVFAPMSVSYSRWVGESSFCTVKWTNRSSHWLTDKAFRVLLERYWFHWVVS